jgi:hypothetical protein
MMGRRKSDFLESFARQCRKPLFVVMCLHLVRLVHVHVGGDSVRIGARPCGRSRMWAVIMSRVARLGRARFGRP